MSLFIDVERDGTVVVREIDALRAGAFLDTIMTAARQLKAVVQRLELRPNRGRVDARILVAPDDDGRGRTEPLELVDALLTSWGTEQPTPA